MMKPIYIFFFVCVTIWVMGSIDMVQTHNRTWLPIGAKVIKELDYGWKLIEINGQQYQFSNCEKTMILPYK